MQLYFTDSESYRIIGYTLAFYCIVFVARNIIKTARHGDFIVNRQLSLGNILGAIGVGLIIPALVTLGGLVVGSIFYVLQEPPHASIGEWEPDSWLHIFTTLVLVCQFFVLLALIALGLYFAGRAIRILILRPVGHGIGNAYRAVRPRVPVRW